MGGAMYGGMPTMYGGMPSYAPTYSPPMATATPRYEIPQSYVPPAMPTTDFGVPQYGGVQSYTPMYQPQYGYQPQYSPYGQYAPTVPMEMPQFSAANNFASAPAMGEADTFLREKGLPIEADPRFQKKRAVEKKGKSGMLNCECF